MKKDKTTTVFWRKTWWLILLPLKYVLFLFTTILFFWNRLSYPSFVDSLQFHMFLFLQLCKAKYTENIRGHFPTLAIKDPGIMFFYFGVIVCTFLSCTGKIFVNFSKTSHYYILFRMLKINTLFPPGVIEFWQHKIIIKSESFWWVL